MKRQTRAILRQFSTFVRSMNATVHAHPILMLGNQKSGTTAIAALLSQMTDTAATLDLQIEIGQPRHDQVKSGAMTMNAYIERNRLDFSRPIVKEPALTLLYDELAAAFPESTFVMVVRDPRDNIRSILNRLDITGNQDDLTTQQRIALTPAWRLNLDNSWLGIGDGNYIEHMAHRWNHAIDLYNRNAQRSILIKYEDFRADKIGVIRGLAEQLGLKEVRDISDKVDIAYQPRGDHNITWPEFFGADNLARIENICAERMTEMGYEQSQP